MTDDAATQPMDQAEAEPVSPEELLKAEIFQEARRCLQCNDRIISLSCQTDDLRNILLEVREQLGEYTPYVFPPPEGITINPDQEQAVHMRRMSDEEGELISAYVKGMIGFIHSQGGLADQLNFPRIPVWNPNGCSQFECVPLVYDSATMRQAFFTMLMINYDNATRKGKVLQLPTMGTVLPR